MANRYAISSSVWSNAAVWSGSIKPVAGDDVYANGYTVTVDEDTPNTLASLNTTATGSIAAGGTFAVTGSRTIHATTTRTGTGHLITLTAPSGSLLTFNGPINGSSTTGNIYGINKTGNCNVTINGNVTGGAGTNSIGVYMNSSGGTLTVVGNVTGGSFSQAYGIQIVGANHIINITGDVVGATTLAIFGAAVTLTVVGNVTTVSGYALYTVGGTITITGNVTAGSSGNSTAMYGGANFNITGNLLGPAATGWDVSNGGAAIWGAGATVYVTGNVTARGGPGLIHSGGAPTVEIVGDVTATTAAPGAVIFQIGMAVGTMKVTGNLVNTGDYMAAVAREIRLQSSGSITWNFKEWDGTTTRTLYSANLISASAVYPTASDVRSGTTFGYTGEYLGTLKMPDKESVLRGVSVGIETGSLQISPVKRFRAGR